MRFRDTNLDVAQLVTRRRFDGVLSNEPARWWPWSSYAIETAAI